MKIWERNEKSYQEYKRGCRLVDAGKVRPVGNDRYRVESESGERSYLVDLGRWSCECEAWPTRAPPMTIPVQRNRRTQQCRRRPQSCRIFNTLWKSRRPMAPSVWILSGAHLSRPVFGVPLSTKWTGTFPGGGHESARRECLF